MSHRYDSAWISGAHLFGNAGLGVLAETIPDDGDDGASYLYNDLSLPADNGKEICGRITTWPSSGTLTAYEDGSFEFDAANGSYSFQYQLYVDGVATGSPATVDLLIGSSPVTVACNLGTAAAVGYQAAIQQGQVIACSLGSASAVGYTATVAQGSVIVCNLGAASGVGYTADVLEAGNLVISCYLGTAQAIGYQAQIVVPVPAVINCALGIAYGQGRQASVIGGGNFVRAPSGSGAVLISASTSRPTQSATSRPTQNATTRI